MSCYIRGGTTRHSDDTMDDDTDDKDDTKRKSRNLSEKKRRDQFNMLVNELGSMVSTNTRKMDKSTVLKSTISFLKNHNEIAVRSRAHEIQEDWKPSFLSNEEFTHLILEALDGFIIVFSCNGRIFYTSQSVTSLLGYLSADLANTSIYDIAYQEDQTLLYNVLGNHIEAQDRLDYNEGLSLYSWNVADILSQAPLNMWFGQTMCSDGVTSFGYMLENVRERHGRLCLLVNQPIAEKQVSFSCHIKIGGLDFREEPVYELVQFVGYFRSDVDVDPDMENFIQNDRHEGILTNDSKLVFVGTGRLQTPQLIREMSVVDSTKSEFTSRHSLEWKFLFLDHRAPPIIGYLPIEVLGTSGYDYYHVDDLDKVVTCHEALMQKGEGTSCHYRFLTKGQQWIWLQSRFYITYNQWNSKPEFVVCTHRVVSYGDVIKQLRKDPEEYDKCQYVDAVKSSSNQQQRQQVASSQSGLAVSSWSSRSSKTSRSVATTSRPRCHGGPGSDTTSVSAGSQSSKHSHQTLQNLRPKESQSVTGLPTGSSRVKPQPELGQCVGFLEPPQYVAAIPVQPIITASFTAPATPAVLSPLQTNDNIVMTPEQNKMQDELQRKHEELQQLIVHQQEELRRVSEQLFFARYGILSPLINVSMPSTSPSCSQAVRCVSSTTNSAQHPMSSPGIQGVSVMPVPITVSVPVVSTELFAHPLAVSPLPTVASSSQYNITRLTSVQQSGNNSNSNLSQQQQQMQQHLQHQEQQRQQSGGPTTPDPAQVGPLSPELLIFQACQQTELMFSHIRSTGSNE